MVDELIQQLHEKHGDFLVEVSVEDFDLGPGLNVNVALSKIPSEEAIHLVSFNAPTLLGALEKAANQ